MSRDWLPPAGAEVGAVGEPIPLDCESDGEPRASLDVPPPPEPAPWGAEGRPVAEELDKGLLDDSVFRVRPDDSSWLRVCCCDPDCGGGKAPAVEDTDEFRLAERRVFDVFGAELRGGKTVRDGLRDREPVRSRGCDVELVEMGGSRRASCCSDGGPQENCWLIEAAGPSDGKMETDETGRDGCARGKEVQE